MGSGRQWALEHAVGDLSDLWLSRELDFLKGLRHPEQKVHSPVSPHMEVLCQERVACGRPRGESAVGRNRVGVMLRRPRKDRWLPDN